jgi:hypothetical protein
MLSHPCVRVRYKKGFDLASVVGELERKLDEMNWQLLTREGKVEILKGLEEEGIYIAEMLMKIRRFFTTRRQKKRFPRSAK